MTSRPDSAPPGADGTESTFLVYLTTRYVWLTPALRLCLGRPGFDDANTAQNTN
jgi:hypothetical protein